MALAGDKPQRYISPSTLGCRCSGDGGWCRRPGGHDDPASADSPLQEILAGVAEAGHPCSESGTCFRTNRSCRLPPAHQGMKTGGAHPSPWIPAEAGITMDLRGPHKTMKMG